MLDLFGPLFFWKASLSAWGEVWRPSQTAPLYTIVMVPKKDRWCTVHMVESAKGGHAFHTSDRHIANIKQNSAPRISQVSIFGIQVNQFTLPNDIFEGHLEESLILIRATFPMLQSMNLLLCHIMNSGWKIISSHSWQIMATFRGRLVTPNAGLIRESPPEMPLIQV